MTSSFTPQARPVDTFVAPSTVAPTTALDQLTRALQTVNPGINDFINVKFDEAIEDAQAIGEDIAREEEEEKGLKKVSQIIKKKDGEEAAKQLIGGSIFSQRAYERTKAKLTGQSFGREMSSLYSSKTFTVIENGNEVTKPIHHFDASSPQYQSFLKEAFALKSEALEGISPKYINQFFQPYQDKAIEVVTAEHIKNHNLFKIDRRKGQLSETLLTNFQEYEEGNEDQAVLNIQEFIEDTVNLGLSDAVKPNDILKIAKNQASRIFEINEQSGGNGYNAAMRYLEMIGKLKHGPKEKQKDGTYKQRLLADSFGEDILKFKVELGDTEDKLVAREVAKKQAAEEADIIKRITENPNNYSVAEEILKEMPWRREFLFDKIEIYAGDRDELFNDFNYRVGTGYYGNDRIRMFNDLDAIKDQIGETWTDEDEQRYKLSGKIARDSVSKRNIGNFDPRIKDMHRDVRALLGAKGEDFNTWNSQDRAKLNSFIDLKTNVNRRIDDELRDVTDLKERENIFREIQAQYFKDAQAINDGSYISKDTLLTTEQKAAKAKEAERQAGIQALVDEYGFGIEDATKIYDEQLNPQEFKDSQEVEKKEEPEKKEESSDKEKSWLDLFLNRSSSLKEEEKDTLIGQLNNAKENLDESGTNIIDSVLNLLMGSAAAEQLTNRSVLEEIDVTKPFTFNSLERLAQEVGFSPEDARIAAAIALAESSGRAGIDTVQSGLDPEKKNEFSLGLWQIDMQDSPGYMLGTDRRQKFGIESNEELYNPLTNAKAAKMIFDTFGFKPWATYTSGKYKDFLPQTN